MKDLEYQEIGRRIETRRKELGLTLADVAYKVGVAPSTILRYEKGKFGKLKLPVLESIAAALHVNPAWLAGETDDPTDYEDGDLLASIPLPYLELFDGDVKKAWAYMQQVDAENKAPSSSLQPLPSASAKTPEEEKMLLLARKAPDIPKEQRHKIIQTFEDTIHLYLEAQGLKKKEDT